MAEGESEEFMEGFICPICKADLGTDKKLIAHFQDSHSEEQDLLKTLKEIFGKAKLGIKKLKSTDTNDILVNRNRLSSPQTSFQWDPQELGVTTSHKSYFEKMRSARMEMYTVNKNRIVIRLDKILHNIPSDSVKRKAHEQEIVPWLDGKAVPRCPDCSCQFHAPPKFTRQHHCRLCGSIMCQNCSNFLPLSTARSMLDKPNENTSSSEEALRICSHCLQTLQKREQIKEMRNYKPFITQLYDKLKEYKAQAEENAALYCKMVDSLCSGETEYSLADTQIFRVNIKKQAETLDVISKKILSLGTENLDSSPGSHSLRLQKSIRVAIVQFIGNLTMLPNLPSEAELNNIQFKRRQEVAVKIQAEKNRDAKSKNNNYRPDTTSLSSSPKHQRSSSDSRGISVGQGWVPEKKQFFSRGDPLIEQMNIIKNYIQEAKAAHKFDEVASLEANLQELNQEYWRQQEEIDRKRDEENGTNSCNSTSIDSNEVESINSNDTHSEHLYSVSSSS